MTAVLDAASLGSRTDLHDALARALDLPAWYGRNLDALYDCLTDRPEETELRLLHPEALGENLGAYGERALETLADAAEENPRFRLILGEDAPSED